jgi:hypothetical protein
MLNRALLLAAVTLALGGSTFAADVKTYQVTGPVLDVNADSITVQKGKESWQIGKAPDTKMSGDVKKGDKVTVMYRMTATSVDAKGGPAKK